MAATKHVVALLVMRAVIVIGLLIVVPLFVAWGNRWFLPGALRRRDDIAPDAFYDTFYGDSGLPRDAVVRVLAYLAGELEIPASKLRPTDGFDTDLRQVTRAWDSGMGLVLDTLASEARAQGRAPPQAIDTVDDYIRAYCALEARAD